MPVLLRTDASPRGPQSSSRQVADTYEQRWRAAHPDGRVVVRDLTAAPVPHLTGATIAGFFSPPEEIGAELSEATAISDVLVAELLAADTLLISTPMYNFSVPSALKAWIDQVVRVGYTFEVAPDGQLRGLIRNKNAVIVTASGAAYIDTPLAGLDFLHPYLRTLLGFLGFEHVEIVTVANTSTPGLVGLSREAAFDRTLSLSY